MKRVLVTFVLALTTAAWGQGSTPSQQPPAGQQPAAGGDQANVPTSQKVIKDPAEYNAYITALNTTDPAAKGQAMEAFVAQYPNSIVKIEALEQAMGAYQQASNQQKVEQFARTDPCRLSPITFVLWPLSFFLNARQIKDAASGAKARADAERGLQELQTWKPDGCFRGGDGEAAQPDDEHLCRHSRFRGLAAEGFCQRAEIL